MVGIAALLLVGCVLGPRSPSGLEVSNGTTLAVTIVVNGSAVAMVEPHGGVTIDPRDLPPLPWVVEARTPSGRLLTSMAVHEGDVQYTANTSRGDATRVDLSCGRLDIWSGPPLLGPAPGPGVPGDCLP